MCSITLTHVPQRLYREYMSKHTKWSSSLTRLTITDGLRTGHIKRNKGMRCSCMWRGYTRKRAEMSLIGTGSCWLPHSSRKSAGHLPDLEIFGHFAALELEKLAGRGSPSTQNWGQILELIKKDNLTRGRCTSGPSSTAWMYLCTWMYPLNQKKINTSLFSNGITPQQCVQIQNVLLLWHFTSFKCCIWTKKKRRKTRIDLEKTMRMFPFLPSKVFEDVQRAKLSGPQIVTTRHTDICSHGCKP